MVISRVVLWLFLWELLDWCWASSGVAIACYTASVAITDYPFLLFAFCLPLVLILVILPLPTLPLVLVQRQYGSEAILE